MDYGIYAVYAALVLCGLPVWSALRSWQRPWRPVHAEQLAAECTLAVLSLRFAEGAPGPARRVVMAYAAAAQGSLLIACRRGANTWRVVGLGMRLWVLIRIVRCLFATRRWGAIRRFETPLQGLHAQVTAVVSTADVRA